MTLKELADKIHEARKDNYFYVGLSMFRSEGNLYELTWMWNFRDSEDEILCYYLNPQLDRYELQEVVIKSEDKITLTYNSNTGWYTLNVVGGKGEKTYNKNLEFIVLPKKSVKI